MRTTLTLDDDVAARLEKLREREDRSFKDLVNDLLRRGLEAAAREVEVRPRYVLRPRGLGRSAYPSLDKTADVLARAEGEDHP